MPAYGAGKLLVRLENAGARIMTKVQPPTALGGRFAKDRFDYRPDRPHRHLPRAGDGADPPGQGRWRYRRVRRRLRRLPAGRAVHHLGHRPHHHDQRLRAPTRPCPHRPGRSRLAADYSATRPKVERKIGHLMRAGTAADVPGSAARPRSPPTSPCSPPRSTWPVSACSACDTPAEAGLQQRHDHRNRLLGSSFGVTSDRHARLARATSTSAESSPMPDTNRHNRHNRSVDNTYPTKPV